MPEEKAKGNLKEQDCIMCACVQRAVLGTEGWTRSTPQSCAPGLQPRLLVTPAPKGHSCTTPAHTHSLTDVHLIPPSKMIAPIHVNSSVCCQQAQVITTLSMAWGVLYLLKVISHSFRLQVLFNRCFASQVDTLTNISPIPVSHLSTVLIFAIALCIVSD